MPVERQPSFAAGELAPTLWGRTDLDRYGIGARTILNFLVTPHGALANRPGTPLVAETKDSAKVQFVPFIASDGDAILLAFGNLHVRFYVWDPATGLAGVIESGPGVPLEVVTPYATADLGRIRWAQSGDILTLVHPNHDPRELKRSSALSWTLALVDTSPPITPPTFPQLTTGVDQVGDATHPPKEWGWIITAVDADGRESVGSMLVRPPATANPATSRKTTLYSDRTVGLVWLQVEGAASYNVYRGRNGVFGWVGSTNGDGGSFDVVTGSWTVVWRDDGDKPDYTRRPPTGKPVFTTPAWTAFTRYDTGDQVVNGGRVYRCIRGGISAAAGGPAGTGASIVDGATTEWAAATAYVTGDVVTANGETFRCSVGGVSGAAPGPYDKISTLLADGSVTWEWKGYGAAARWEYLYDAPAKKRFPATVTFFEGRRVFGNTEEDPSQLLFSRVDQWEDFEEYSNSPDDAPTRPSLASKRREEIRSLVERHELVALTSASEWLVRGAGQGETIAPGRVAAHPPTKHGSSWLPALEVGTAVLFVQQKGSLPRAMLFGDAGGYVTTDLGILSRHLFAGRTIVDWAYAEDPWSIVWAVTDDGALLSLTFVRDHDLAAWTRHETDGVVEAVCTLPEGDEDALYLCVRRTIGGQTRRFIERMATRQVDDARLGVFLDCSLTYDGRNRTATTVTLTGGATWLADDELDVASSAPAFAASNVDDVLVLQPDARISTEVAGETFFGAPGSAAVRLTIIGYTDPQHIRVRADATVPEAFRGVASTDWALAVGTFTGLGHLEGKEVGVLADGAVQGPFTVVGGAFELETPAAIVHAGLPYVSDLETLDAQPGEAKGRVKTVKAVSFEFESSRGGFTGERFGNLEEFRQRDVNDGYGPIALRSGVARVHVSGRWGTGGRAVLRQVDPLPMTVLAVAREVEFGGA